MSVDVIWGMKSSVVVACPKILNPFECFPSIVWVCMVVMHGLSEKTIWLLSSYALVGLGARGGRGRGGGVAHNHHLLCHFVL